MERSWVRLLVALIVGPPTGFAVFLLLGGLSILLGAVPSALTLSLDKAGPTIGLIYLFGGIPAFVAGLVAVGVGEFVKSRTRRFVYSAVTGALAPPLLLVLPPLLVGEGPNLGAMGLILVLGLCGLVAALVCTLVSEVIDRKAVAGGPSTTQKDT